MKQNCLVPELRFPGFDEEWEVKKLGDVADKPSYGINNAATTFNGIDKYIRITDIDESSRKFVGKPLCSPQGGGIEEYIVKKGDILFARTGASVGKTYHYEECDGRLFFAGFLIKFSINRADSKFVFYFTNHHHYYNWVNRMSVRSCQPGVSAEELSTLKIPFPTLPEQTRISNFLTNIDDQINTLVKKKLHLQECKKGILQKLFSQQIRFKDDTGNDFDDWKESRLGEVAIFLKGKNISKSDLCENGGNECILYGELYTTYSEIISDIISKTNKNKDLILSKANDVIIPSSGESIFDISKSSCVCKDGVILGGDLNIIRSSINGVFLSHYITHYKNREIANLAQGISVVHLYGNQLKTLCINIPPTLEQQKITTLLTIIDDKLINISKKSDILKKLKKGFLQKMFV